MMAQPKKYLAKLVSNTFLKYAVADVLKESVTFKNGGSYEILNLTEGKARSRRIDGITFDEEAQAEQAPLDAAEATLSVSQLGLIRRISTPVKGSPFEINIKRMQHEGAPVIIRPWWDLPHINPAFVERQRRKLPAWFFRQEYECTVEAPQGRVFENVIEGPYDLSSLDQSYRRTYTHYGVDWNPRAGHYLGGCRWNDDYTKNYVIMERNMGTDLGTVLDILFDLLLSQPHALVELEDGGTNMGYCDAFFLELYKRAKADPRYHEVARRIFRRPWDSAGKNKHKSITTLIAAQIYVDPALTPEIAQWLAVAHWDETSTEPKLEKDPDQHALDVFLHASWIAKWGVSSGG